MAGEGGGGAVLATRGSREVGQEQGDSDRGILVVWGSLG